MMKKILMLAATVLAVTLLSVPTALAAPSPTEPDRPLTELGDSNLPLMYLHSPQTGETGLDGIETLTLAAGASTVCGAVILARAKKQTGSAA